MQNQPIASPKTKLSLGRIILFIVGCLATFALVFGVTFFVMYQQDIGYKTTGEMRDFEVQSGESVETIGRKLEESGLVKNWKSFRLYAILNRQTNIKVGHYQISPEMTIPEVLDILNSGQSQSIALTFLPGGTVKMAKDVLLKAGFAQAEIDAAFKKDYTSEFPQLFESKPAEADLEGYIYGETYSFDKGVKVEDVLRRTFKEMQQVIVSGDLKAKYAAHDLNLYQGITLASIVQKEEPHIENQKAVAGVFFNRIAQGMNLGSDPTYQYAADKMGVPRDYNLDSPYNTRIYKGLTPTPIASPSASALQAVAEPADNSYLFFLSGDDDQLYFGATDQEHQQNIVNHCQKKCQIL